MKGIPESLTREVNEIRDKIASEQTAGQAEKAKADQLVEKYRAQGINPLDSAEAFAEVDNAYKAADAHAQNASELKDRLLALAEHRSIETIQSAGGDPEKLADKLGVSIGQRFADDPSVRAITDHLAAVGGSNGVTFSTPGVDALSRDEVQSYLFLAATLDAGATVPRDQRLWPPIGIPQRALRMRDLVTVSQTDSDTVDYVEETTLTHAAAETPYGTAAPEASYAYTKRTATVRRIPHFTPASEGQLMDNSQLRSLVDNRLVYGVGKRLDTQIYGGDGAGENLRGILNTAGIGTYDYLEGASPDETSITDGLHKAITVVRLSLEDEPDAFVLHPTNYQGFVLERESGATGSYLNVPNGVNPGPSTAWGLPVVVSTVAAVGTGLCGNFKIGAELWLRTGIVVSATNSHSDFFTRGLVAVMATLRAAFAVVQPKAFCSITTIPAA